MADTTTDRDASAPVRAAVTADKPDNEIARRKAVAEEPRDALAIGDISPVASRKPSSGADTKDDDPVKPRPVADELAKRYIIVDAKNGKPASYTEDGRGEAFNASDTHLRTKFDEGRVVNDMVRLAQERGWEKLGVSGTAKFKDEVWLEANKIGLAVDHKPSELAQARLNYWKQTKPDNAVEEQRTADGERLGDKFRRLSPEQRLDDPVMAGAQRLYTSLQKVAADRLGPGTEDAMLGIVADRLNAGEKVGYKVGTEQPDKAKQGVEGKIVATGSAEYDKSANGKQTPFIEVERPGGERHKAWGVGLPAALEASGKGIGDTVVLERTGSERVQVKQTVTDKETGVDREVSREVDRNKWVVTAAPSPIVKPAPIVQPALALEEPPIRQSV